jgi:hypothetical protein
MTYRARRVAALLSVLAVSQGDAEAAVDTACHGFSDDDWKKLCCCHGGERVIGRRAQLLPAAFL